MRNHKTSIPVALAPSCWTGKCQPWTLGNQAIHEEIASSQVVHWTPQQIQAAERKGYFQNLTERCQQRRYVSLLDEQEELDLE